MSRGQKRVVTMRACGIWRKAYRFDRAITPVYGPRSGSPEAKLDLTAALVQRTHAKATTDAPGLHHQEEIHSSWKRTISPAVYSCQRRNFKHIPLNASVSLLKQFRICLTDFKLVSYPRSFGFRRLGHMRSSLSSLETMLSSGTLKVVISQIGRFNSSSWHSAAHNGGGGVLQEDRCEIHRC